MSEDVVVLQKMVRDLTDIVSSQKQEIEFLKRHIFGKKSERFIAAPRQLSIEGLEAQLPDTQPQKSAEVTQVITEKQKPVRKPLDESKFEVIVEELQPEGSMEQMTYISVEETTYQVLVDAKIVLKKIKRYKYQKASGEIVIADMPYRPFAKSAVSSSIVSEVLVQKFVDAMPIYRQEQSWKRVGVEFAYSSLSDMQRMGYELIKPLFDAYKKHVLSPTTFKLMSRRLRCFPVRKREHRIKGISGFIWIRFATWFFTTTNAAGLRNIPPRC